MVTKRVKKRHSLKEESIEEPLTMAMVDLDTIYRERAHSNGYTLFLAPFGDHEVLGKILGYDSVESYDAIVYESRFDTRDQAIHFLMRIKAEMEKMGTNLSEVEVMLYYGGVGEELESYCPI